MTKLKLNKESYYETLEQNPVTMWSYYGAKTYIIHLYPPPKYGKIIEPFAGTARYALKYWDREVLLVDKYDVIIRIWKWLQRCSPGDILGLPLLKQGQKIDKLNICEEAKLFLGMNAAVSSIAQRNTISYFAAEKNGRKNQFKIVANDLYKIRHWKLVHGSYVDMDNEEANSKVFCRRLACAPLFTIV